MKKAGVGGFYNKYIRKYNESTGAATNLATHFTSWTTSYDWTTNAIPVTFTVEEGYRYDLRLIITCNGAIACAENYYNEVQVEGYWSRP
jgi:hypothetical protein